MSDRNEDSDTADLNRHQTSANPTVVNEKPQRIDRYRIEKLLGHGGFGRVFLAFDEQLNRHVAIKVPHASMVQEASDAEAYLAEARTAASLDHPNIVPVHDVGTTDTFPCYVVSKFIEGGDLARRLSERRFAPAEAATLVALVADGLHYAHKQGVIHRDIKPANILIDQSGAPFIVDFGLALLEEKSGEDSNYAGTPAYMSPEQARSEGHRVDGRSDVFSLGIVLYELLVGRRPFRGDTHQEVLERVTSYDPRPLRQCDERIPEELDRICQKAMSKRASERYSSAHDLAEDLRHFSKSHAAELDSLNRDYLPDSTRNLSSTTQQQSRQPPSTHVADSLANSVVQANIRIIPKGLRSFDSHDSEFYLELVPGPRDREGLPDSIRFWKNRIETLDAERTFPVGLLYGPSGCGKSSFVKAGLIPRLASHIIPIYVEAVPDQTEESILRRIRRACPLLDPKLDLKSSLLALRKGEGLRSSQKLLIVLDQFEQWLHSHADKPDSELIQALRQCDGGRVQCVLMVRDDFWMAATRIMRALEIRLVEASNSAAVDLFPIRHAEKVLVAFGRAFDALSATDDSLSREEKAFIVESVSGLAENGKVNCARLALFAAMMKDKRWAPSSLQSVGGTEGVGVAFLEETFCATTAPPAHRAHVAGARAILARLLPEAGTDIKGHMRSRDDLMGTAGYRDRPREFEELLRILDSETRLITPVDPGSVSDGSSDEDAAETESQAHEYYQLAHDYLVPSLRDWLTRKQRESRSGRARLLMDERAAVWSVRPENRHLPTMMEYISFRRWTRPHEWSASQLRMMSRASKVLGLRALAVISLLAVVLLAAIWIDDGIRRKQEKTAEDNLENERHAEAVAAVDKLASAQIQQVPVIIQELDRLRPAIDDVLLEQYEKSDAGSSQQLNLGLALLPIKPEVTTDLITHLLAATPDTFFITRDVLAPQAESVALELWKTAASNDAPKGEVFRSLCALATFDPDDTRWTDPELREFVVDYLIGVRPSELGPWQRALRPVRNHLVGLLEIHFREADREQRRMFATYVLADYVSDNAASIYELLVDADLAQFELIESSAEGHRDEIIELCRHLIQRPVESAADVSNTVRLANRQANAAVFLMLNGHEDSTWRLLKHSANPGVRSELIHRVALLGVDVEILLTAMRSIDDVSTQRALLLALSEYAGDAVQLSAPEFIDELLDIYRETRDAGLRSAAEFLIGRLELRSELVPIRREAKMGRIQQQREFLKEHDWFVNSQLETFCVVDLQTVEIGSPPEEPNRKLTEARHPVRFDRKLVFAARELSRRKWDMFAAAQAGVIRSSDGVTKSYSKFPNSPIGGVSWYEAAHYCNWLSEKEGIDPEQWCYVKNSEGEYGPGMKAKPRFWTLEGYRLPTEAEWEAACRAGASTSRYYGDNLNLLSFYAWEQSNSDGIAHAPGLLKPNDFGLFDMHGNLIEWCSEAYNGNVGADGALIKDEPPIDEVSDGVLRCLRGSSIYYQPAEVRSAKRDAYPPMTRNGLIGFRICRTLVEKDD